MPREKNKTRKWGEKKTAHSKEAKKIATNKTGGGSGKTQLSNLLSKEKERKAEKLAHLPRGVKVGKWQNPTLTGEKGPKPFWVPGGGEGQAEGGF